MRLLFNTALGAVSLFVISCQQGADHQHTDAANAAAKDTTAVVVNPRLRQSLLRRALPVSMQNFPTPCTRLWAII